MANGYTNGGGSPPPTPPLGSPIIIGYENGGKNPAYQKLKSVSYNATNSDQIYSLVDSTSATSPSVEMPKRIELKNTGRVALMVMVGYKAYSDKETIDATDFDSSGDGVNGETRYIHYMLMPGEIYLPPVRGVIVTGYDANVTQFDGTVVDNAKLSAINSGLLWKDSTANIKAHVRPAGTDPITITVGTNETNLFRAGDLIQIGRGTTQTDLTEATYYREILRVQSITDGEDMVCERGLYGTDAGDYDSTNWSAGHAIDQPIYFPFFNAYHDVDKYSVAQTDGNGKFKAYNLFGTGRSASQPSGLVPSSFALKFYEAGYQKLGLSGITSSTNSGLTASTAYKIDITVDGGTLFQDLTFTTDTSDLSFGKVIRLIQSAFDTQYYTAGNLFEKKVYVGIENGDVVFRSGSRLSTSAILLADTGAALSFIDETANGRIPAAGNIPSPIAAKLPDDVVYDRVTYATSPNTGAFCYDDGNGKLSGMCGGTINYETGAIDMTGCPPNAEFVYSVAHTSAFSGKLGSSSTTKGGSLTDILANTPSSKWDGQIDLKVF